MQYVIIKSVRLKNQLFFRTKSEICCVFCTYLCLHPDHDTPALVTRLIAAEVDTRPAFICLQFLRQVSQTWNSKLTDFLRVTSKCHSTVFWPLSFLVKKKNLTFVESFSAHDMPFFSDWFLTFCIYIWTPATYQRYAWVWHYSHLPRCSLSFLHL
jgi:hypothetical protein